MKVRYTHQQTTPSGVVVQHDYEGAGPMLSTARMTNYAAQNGPFRYRRFTAAQSRQVRKASTRLLYRGSRAAS